MHCNLQFFHVSQNDRTERSQCVTLAYQDCQPWRKPCAVQRENQTAVANEAQYQECRRGCLIGEVLSDNARRCGRETCAARCNPKRVPDVDPQVAAQKAIIEALSKELSLLRAELAAVRRELLAANEPKVAEVTTSAPRPVDTEEAVQPTDTETVEQVESVTRVDVKYELSDDGESLVPVRDTTTASDEAPDIKVDIDIDAERVDQDIVSTSNNTAQTEQSGSGGLSDTKAEETVVTEQNDTPNIDIDVDINADTVGQDFVSASNNTINVDEGGGDATSDVKPAENVVTDSDTRPKIEVTVEVDADTVQQDVQSETDETANQSATDGTANFNTDDAVAPPVEQEEPRQVEPAATTKAVETPDIQVDVDVDADTVQQGFQNNTISFDSANNVQSTAAE